MPLWTKLRRLQREGKPYIVASKSALRIVDAFKKEASTSSTNYQIIGFMHLLKKKKWLAQTCS